MNESTPITHNVAENNQKPPYKFLVDGNEANVVNRVGSNVFAFELLSALEKRTRSLAKTHHFTIALSSEKVSDLPKSRRGWQYVIFGPRRFWTQWALPLYIWRHQDEYSLFFTPGHYGPRLSSLPLICSVMDTAYLDFPSHFKVRDYLQLKNWTKQTVSQASHVITISEFSKQNVIESYGVDPAAVSVIYPALAKVKDNRNIKNIRRKYRLPDHYFVYVGTLQPRKNIVRIVHAFEELLQFLTIYHGKADLKLHKKLPTPSEIGLVLVGKEGWLAQPILDRISTSTAKQSIIMTGFVEETEKQALIAESEATILVGLHEGFGIPALEAMQYGSIPIVSNSSSLPEVVGEAGYLVDPYSVSEIRAAMQSVLELSAFEKATLLKQGRTQKNHFSWDTAAKKVLAILEKVAHEHKRS